MAHSTFSRRQVLAASGSALAAGAVGTGAIASRAAGQDGFEYEVARTDAEWREMLAEGDYAILREGATETPKTSALWNETREGRYFCKGCELHVYESEWKVELDIGYAFFRHAVPNSILTGVDWFDGVEPDPAQYLLSGLETHCRRCGSHQGHVFIVQNQLLHCINGAALTFEPSMA